MKPMSTKTRFRIGAACILLLICTTVSTATYYYLKDLATDEIYKETEIFIGTADATRTYVKDVLRPKVSALVAPDDFIPHAMSTSFVGREIMNRLQLRFPNFQYKRAAGNPMNPANQADGFERSMLDWFAQNTDRPEWYGLIKKGGRAFYTRLRAIYAESDCLVCHGRPADAPAAMKALYGTGGGYGYRVGEVVAADTIYIPVDVTFVRIKEAAWLVFLIAVVSMFALLGLFYLLFNRTVISEMKGLITRLQHISSETAADPPEVVPSAAGDEFELLKGAFENVAAELKTTHDELKASETKYRQIFETSRDAILIMDAAARIRDINEAGVRLFGFDDKDAAHGPEGVRPLFQQPADAADFLHRLQSDGFVQGFEVSMTRRGGKSLRVMISATARRDADGHLAGIDGTFVDVTEKRRLEKYLAQAEKLAAIGQLASGVAHEINNPLGVIKCYAGLIAKGQSADSQLTNDIRVIQKHTEQCKTVVEALLNFARIPEPKKTDTDLHGCINEVLAVLEPQLKKQGIVVQRTFAADLPSLRVDAHQIKQVLMNLFMNARQAMPEGGQLSVRTVASANGDRLVLEIADTGTGIADDHIERIFDPFFTTKSAGKGTGLGLSVSYGIIKQHGGDIEVESAPGRGSRFTILLPTGLIAQKEN